MRSLLHRVAPVAVAVALAGCTSSSRSAPDTPAPASSGGASTPSTSAPPSPAESGSAGGTLVTKADAGFAIRLPPGWKEIPLDPADLQAAIEATKKDNPQLAAVLAQQGQRAVQQGGKLFAVKNGTSGATNLNLIKIPAADATLSEVVSGSVQQLAKTGVRDVVSTPLTLPAGSATRVTFTLPVNNPSGQAVLLQDTQYYLVEGGQAYVVTFTTPDRSANEAAVTATMASLRLLGQ